MESLRRLWKMPEQSKTEEERKPEEKRGSGSGNQVRKEEKGSIVILTLLSLSVVLSSLLVLLEGSRQMQMNSLADLYTQTAIEGVFADFQTDLWEEYRLLGTWTKEAKETMRILLSREESEKNLLNPRPKTVEITDYTLLTDGRGRAFAHAVASYMKENLLYEGAKSLYERYQGILDLVDRFALNGSEIEDAIGELEKMENENARARSGSQENFLKKIQRLKKTQLLELVLEDTSTLSDAEWDLKGSVSQRTLQEGTWSLQTKIGWVEKICLEQYFMNYFSFYTREKEGREGLYEAEYLIGKKASDIENLREVVNRILVIREAANLAYLFSDAEKTEAVGSMALLLAGASANAIVVEAVKIGILAAWAFAEAVLDLRALLLGKKVSLLKSSKTWTCGLEEIGRIAEDFAVAKESSSGMSYMGYLEILLLLEDGNDLAMYGMDAEERTIQNRSPEIYLDQLMIDAQIEVTFLQKGRFISSIQKEIVKTGRFSYYGDERKDAMGCLLKKMTYLDKISPQLLTRTNNVKKEASHCIFHRASLTVEAVVVLPFAVSVLVAFLFFFQVMRFSYQVEEALNYAGRKTAVESSIVSEPVLLGITAKMYLTEKLEGGGSRVSLIGSEFDGEWIVLHAQYKMDFPMGLFGIRPVEFHTSQVFHKWNYTERKTKQEESDQVYVTATGEVYHRSPECRVLKLKIKQVAIGQIEELRGENGQKYWACHRCISSVGNVSMVYVTDYGNNYHATLECSALKRSIVKIDLKEVGERRPCKICYGGE